MFPSIAEIVDQELPFGCSRLIPINEVFNRQVGDYHSFWGVVSGAASEVFFDGDYRAIASEEFVGVFELVGGDGVTLITTPLLITLLYLLWHSSIRSSFDCTLPHLERIGAC